jgi:hypothetical protein
MVIELPARLRMRLPIMRDPSRPTTVDDPSRPTLRTVPLSGLRPERVIDRPEIS